MSGVRSAFGFLVPELYHRHRGYALVALGLAQLHFVSFLDHVLPGAPARHSGIGWSLTNRLLAEQWWGLIHLACGMAICVGAYNIKRIIYARFAFAASVTTYLLLGFSWGYVGIVHLGQATASSILGIGIALMAVFCSVAAALEPPRNPETERSHA